jgi:hypothetical protein
MIATARALLSWQVFFLTFLGEPITAKPQLFLAENHLTECRFFAGNAPIYQKSASLMMRTALTDACLFGQRRLSSSNLAKW